MTDELDTVHNLVKANLDRLTGATMADTNLATTQAFITTTQHWTATDAAAILIEHHGLAALDMTRTDRIRALTEAVAHRARIYTPDRDTLALRKAIINDHAEPPQLNYTGTIEIDPADVPSVFNPDTDHHIQHMDTVTGDRD